MGNQKLKWTAEEEEALMAGIAKYGPGKWKHILVDDEFSHKLSNRSNVDLKDKWRNLGSGHGYGHRENPTTPQGKVLASNLAAPKVKKDSSVPISEENADECRNQSLPEAKNAVKNEIILEAVSSVDKPIGADIGAISEFIEAKYDVPQNFRRSLGSKLKRLVSQGKLEKVDNGYKIKVASNSTKPSTSEQMIVQPESTLYSNSIVSCNVIEQSEKKIVRPKSTRSSPVVEEVVKEIVNAENLTSMTMEACKVAEQIELIAEHADAMLVLAEELYELCSENGIVVLP